MEWFTRDKIWKRAPEEQISCAKNYLETNQEEQMIGVFKDVRYKKEIPFIPSIWSERQLLNYCTIHPFMLPILTASHLNLINWPSPHAAS